MEADGSGLKKVLSLGSSARKSKLQSQRTSSVDSRAARRLKQIEEGGALPQWGPAGN